MVFTRPSTCHFLTSTPCLKPRPPLGEEALPPTRKQCILGMWQPLTTSPGKQHHRVPCLVQQTSSAPRHSTLDQQSGPEQKAAHPGRAWGQPGSPEVAWIQIPAPTLLSH